jgi:hypothetical protein
VDFFPEGRVEQALVGVGGPAVGAVQKTAGLELAQIFTDGDLADLKQGRQILDQYRAFLLQQLDDFAAAFLAAHTPPNIRLLLADG